MRGNKGLQIGVIGGSRCDSNIAEIAYHVGREIGKRGAVLICGGLGGVMESAARGVVEEGGIAVGVIPTYSKWDANQFIGITITTGLGHARNVIVVSSSDGLIAIGGEFGTLSEIAFAMKMGKPIVGIKTWDIPGIIKAETAREAVEILFEIVKKGDIKYGGS